MSTIPAHVVPIAATALPEPTLEQLRLAYRHLSHPNRWPQFDAAVNHPVYGTCLRALARNPSRPRWHATPVVVSLPQGMPVPPTPDAPSRRGSPGATTTLHRRAVTGGSIDLKRRAANDRDD